MFCNFHEKGFQKFIILENMKLSKVLSLNFPGLLIFVPLLDYEGSRTFRLKCHIPVYPKE